MTANQISFYKAKNEKEHYDRLDEENKRHNLTSEALNQSDLNLKDWYNKASIAKDYANIDMLRYHYGQSDEAALSNARSNAINASTSQEKTQLDLAREYGYVTFDPTTNSYIVSPTNSGYGPLSYQIAEQDLKKKKIETALQTFETISGSLGSLGRLVGPLSQAVIKVME